MNPTSKRVRHVNELVIHFVTTLRAERPYKVTRGIFQLYYP